MALFDTTGFRLLEQGLDIVNQNKNVILNNLANVDTPGFKCKYLYFSGVLKDKLNASEKTRAKKELHLSSYIYTDDNTYDQPDGNNVDNDTQQALFVKNGLLQQALINQMNSELTLLRSAMNRQ